MSIFSRIITIILVITIGAITSLLYIFMQGNVLERKLNEYPLGSTKIALYNIPTESSANILLTLKQFAQENNLAITRSDARLSNADGSITGYRIGVLANPSQVPEELALSFLGTTIYSSNNIEKLLKSSSSKTIGLDENSADIIISIPEIPFAPTITVMQLDRLIETSETIQGTYNIIGATDVQINDLAKTLEPLTQQTSEEMLNPLKRQISHSNLIEMLLIGFLLAVSALLMFLLIFEAVRSSKVLGVHILLGKSTLKFTAQLFTPIIITAGVTVILATIFTLIMFKDYTYSYNLILAALSNAFAGMLVVLLSVIIAATVLLSIKPVDAILERYSKKVLIIVITSFYILSSAGLTTTFIALDGPIKEVARVNEINNAWKDYNDYQILYSHIPGIDQNDLINSSGNYTKDTYEWYKSIADKPGVNIVHVSNFDETNINGWREGAAYDNVPENAFWYMVASPNYLKTQKFSLSDEIIKQAKNGERIFLIPNSWSESEKKAMQNWILEDNNFTYEPSIITKYTENRVIKFVEYTPEEPLFMWNTNIKLPQKVKDPVILVITPENMIPFESESLKAIGLDNSYIKLSNEANKKYNTQSYLAKYNLDDNKPTYLPISDFIAGIKKDLQTTMLLFGSVAMFLFIFCITMLLTLMKTFTTTYKEFIAVKRMLGYSIIRIFMVAFILVAVVNIFAILTVIIAQSNSGLLANITMFVIQIFMLLFLAQRYSQLQLSSALKE